MLKYELLIVLPGTLDDKQVAEKAEEIVKLVGELGSDVTLHAIGKNRLAYPVKQIRYGYYYTITFQAEPRSLAALEGKLSIHREVLRFLISHFNTNLTSQQKVAYTTESSGMTRVAQREELESRSIGQAGQKSKVVAKGAMLPGQGSESGEKLNLEEINKKLDDLMGDVVKGV